MKAGNQYLIASDIKGDLAAMFVAPNSSEAVTPDADTVGEVELILRSASLPLNQQAERASEVLVATRRHSGYFLQYVAMLLTAGSASDTVYLAQALDDASVRFPDETKVAMLGSLSWYLRASDEIPETLATQYASLTIRWLLADPDSTAAKPLLVQESILQTFLPEIRRSASTLAALRRLEMSSTDLEKLRARARALAVDPSIGPTSRAQAHELQSLFRSRQ